MAASPNNPAFNPVFHPNLVQRYEKRPNDIQPLGLRMKFYLDAAKINTNNIAEIETPPIPLWIMPTPKVIMELGELKKATTNPIEYHERFNRIRCQYSTSTFLYTDGSKDSNRTAYAVTSCTTNYCSERLPDESSIYTAELTAIWKATRLIANSDIQNSVICSDSKSALQALANKRTDHPVVLDILMSNSMLLDVGKEIVYCWIPGHVGIVGNDKADYFAKQALTHTITDYTLPYGDFRPLINDFIWSSFQIQWNACATNKLHCILPNVKDKILFNPTSRRDRVVIYRCLIGHTRLTHSYLLLNKPAPVCEECQCPLTVKHILLECTKFQQSRQALYQANSLRQLFTKYDPVTILQFLKITNLYHQL